MREYNEHETAKRLHKLPTDEGMADLKLNDKHEALMTEQSVQMGVRRSVLSTHTSNPLYSSPSLR